MLFPLMRCVIRPACESISKQRHLMRYFLKFYVFYFRNFSKVHYKCLLILMYQRSGFGQLPDMGDTKAFFEVFTTKTCFQLTDLFQLWLGPLGIQFKFHFQQLTVHIHPIFLKVVQDHFASYLRFYLLSQYGIALQAYVIFRINNLDQT